MWQLLARLRCFFGWHKKVPNRLLGIKRGRKITLHKATVCRECGKVLQDDGEFK